MVATGAVLPVAPLAYSVTESTLMLATNRCPAESTATPSGPSSPVADPEMVATGVSFPEAPIAYSVTESAPVLATNE